MHLPGDGGYFGLNPGADGRVNVTYVTDLTRLGKDVRAHAEETLRLALDRCPTLRPRFADATLEGDVAVLAPLEVRVHDVMTDGVLLAGDAAGFLDPLTGEGLYGAVVSGRLAGFWAGRAALARRTGSAYLRGYAHAYKRAFGSKRKLNGLLQRILARPRVLRYLGHRLAANRPLGDALIGVIGNLEGPGALLRPRHLMGLVGIAR
jgi:flavin-dependent dehydrogenase